MERKLLNDVALGAFIFGALAVLAYMSIAVGGLKVGKAIVVTAKFDNAAGLVKDGAVLVAGVNVGSVEGLTVSHDKAIVRLRLKEDAAIRQDVKAAIRMKSLLGEKYVELLPQSETAPMLADGGTIAETTVPVEVDEVMKQIAPALQGVDPKDVSIIVHSLAQTLAGRGDTIGTAIDQTTETLGTLNRVLARNEGKLDSMLTNLDKAAAQAPKLTERLDRLASDLEPTLEAAGTHAPSLLARMDRLAGRLEPATEVLAKRGPALMDKTERTLDALDPTLARTPKTLDSANATLARLPRTLDKLEALVSRLDESLARVDGVLDQTKGQALFHPDGSFKVKAKLF